MIFRQSHRLFLARDRIGVKPFFYAIREGALIFASELKTLLAHPAVEPVIDADGLAEILLLGPGRTPGCGVFRDVFELEPGWRGYFSQEGLRLSRYWQLTPHEHAESFADTAAHVRELVTDAIARQLVSDVPVCTFLSGGLDSSIISAVADAHMAREGRTLHTFSVDYTDNDKYFQASHFQPNSDSRYIDVMNGTLQAVNHRVVLDSADVAQALRTAVEARDLPGMADVDSSLLLFCGRIREHATVALSGECADEIFGGYPWYRDKNIREQEGFPWAQSTAYLSAVSAMLREILADPDSPLLRIADREALAGLLNTDRAAPWYGQLMTTPQTIAYFVQVDHWLRHYRVRVL